METSVILQILTTLGISTILASVVNYLMTKKKLGADASKIITDAATALVDSTQKRLKELEDFKRDREAYDAQLTSRLARHEMWDHRVYSALLKLDPAATIESPPSLFINYPHLPPDSGGEYEVYISDEDLPGHLAVAQEPPEPIL